MLFRVGVNLGDVVVKNEDLLGDGEPVAVRRPLRRPLRRSNP